MTANPERWSRTRRAANRRVFSIALPPLFLSCLMASLWAKGPFQANGVKIGEVTPTSVVVWTRLTEDEPPKEALKRASFSILPTLAIGGQDKGRMSDRLVNAYRLEGADGEVRAIFWPLSNPSAALGTDWREVATLQDHTRQFTFTGLQPSTRYGLRVESRPLGGGNVTSVTEGGFRTAPSATDPARVVFTVITGQKYDKIDDSRNGFDIYPAMAKLDPDFMVHTGDIVYYDRFDLFADNIEVARTHWHRMYSLPFLRDFHNRYNAYFMKDDHDVVSNDCYPGTVYRSFTFAQGQAVFKEQVPMSSLTYRTFRWGKDVQVWLTEGRDYRAQPNEAPDGPNKTIWGATQKEWFKRTVRESDATFRFLINATPLVGPDRATKNDSHANAGFQHESRELRQFLSEQRMIVIVGDRHWQYSSVEDEAMIRARNRQAGRDSDYPLVEYCCGPTSDKHAGGTLPGEEAMHRFLRIKGGFLSVTVERSSGSPTATIRYHDTKGREEFKSVVDPNGRVTMEGRVVVE